VRDLRLLERMSCSRRGTTSLAQIAANGSGLVRHARGSFVSLGSGPSFQTYALRSLIAAAAAADAIVFPSAIFFLRSLTCSSVTIGTPGAPRPARNSGTAASHVPSGRRPTCRSSCRRPAEVIVVHQASSNRPTSRDRDPPRERVVEPDERARGRDGRAALPRSDDDGAVQHGGSRAGGRLGTAGCSRCCRGRTTGRP
jgi:hypothetical protein